MSNLLKLTPENYYTKEANMQYVSVSQYKEFNGTTGKMGCEAYAMAKLRGEVEEVTTTALMVGSYVDAYFEGTLPTFSAQHPEIFSSRGKTAGELKSEYKQASIMIDRAVKDPVFMQYMAGDKQVIMTGEIEGVPVKIKIDSADGRRITDLKTVKSITETFYAKDLGQRLNFCECWGYDLQAAVYREIYRQNTGDAMITAKELAEKLNGRAYGDSFDDVKQEAKESGLVIVYGASDDLMEFDGAIYDEGGCFDGGRVYFDRNGVDQEGEERANWIDAVWCDGMNRDGLPATWTYETEIPCERLSIWTRSYQAASCAPPEIRECQEIPLSLSGFALKPENLSTNKGMVYAVINPHTGSSFHIKNCQKPVTRHSNRQIL